jgi:hypothetical protein
LEEEERDWCWFAGVVVVVFSFVVFGGIGLTGTNATNLA